MSLEYISPRSALVPVTFGTQIYMLPEGENLAAALLSAGVNVTRFSAVSGLPRGPFCMMGSCFECRVVIDGISKQACLTQVSQGLVIQPSATNGE